MKRHPMIRRFSTLFTSLFMATVANAQKSSPGPVFRLDGGNATYAFGVNERGDLQTLYWGGRIGSQDAIPPAHSFPEWASFDSTNTTTPQEYSGWGAGLFTEPALKITFAVHTRVLAVHFVNRTPDDTQARDVVLKDISRDIF